MFDDFQNNIEQRKSIIALLYRMASTDKKISPIEKRYLNDIATNIGLDTFSVEEILKNPNQYKLETPPDEGGRMKILYYLLFMMKVDGVINEQEEKLIYEAGFRLGFNQLLTTDLIRVMKTYLNDDVPPEAMLEQIRKYMN